jgi:membrane carboxypeptidase/penicillin-binding protein
VFANGGFKVDPYFVDRIEDANGKVVYQAAPKIACEECEHPAALSDVTLRAGRRSRVLQSEDSVRGGAGPLTAGTVGTASHFAAE